MIARTRKLREVSSETRLGSKGGWLTTAGGGARGARSRCIVRVGARLQPRTRGGRRAPRAPAPLPPKWRRLVSVAYQRM